jgi:hypothetical protein
MLFTPWVEKPDDKTLYGWFMVALISLFIGFNIIIVVCFIIKEFKLAIKKYYLIAVRKFNNSILIFLKPKKK